MASLGASETKAKTAVAAAQEALKEVERLTKENQAYVPIIQGVESEAKVALQTAKDAAKEAHDIVDETRVAAKAAAIEAAKQYLMEVKRAGTAATKSAAEARAAAESAAETKAAMAAAKAVEPYHLQMMRGQKVMTSYQARANELAAASNNLKAQSQILAGSANGYQFVGQVVQAQQIMMQANELMNYAEMMKKEAIRLHGIAGQIGGAMQAYSDVAGAAAEQAQEGANGPILPDIAHPYFIQRAARRSLLHAANARVPA